MFGETSFKFVLRSHVNWYVIRDRNCKLLISKGVKNFKWIKFVFDISCERMFNPSRGAQKVIAGKIVVNIFSPIVCFFSASPMQNFYFQVRMNVTILFLGVNVISAKTLNFSIKRHFSRVNNPVKYYTCASKCNMTASCGLFSNPSTTCICVYILVLPRFCSCTLAFLQKIRSSALAQLQFVHVTYYPVCALVLIKYNAN